MKRRSRQSNKRPCLNEGEADEGKVAEGDESNELSSDEDDDRLTNWGS